MTFGSDDQRDWISLNDSDGATWLFDLSFLLSRYQCIYGAGCPSIGVEPDPTGSIGCCTHGAHFVDRDDHRRVLALAEQLTDDEWQHRARAERRGGPTKKKQGEWVTRKVDGACIFLNRHDFPGGAGCALHTAALRRGERPIDWKPTVCWQVPIRFDVHTDDYGHETVLVRAWQRRDWGPGGADFHWWCTEEKAAHTATDPVYVTAREELIELCGEALYRRLAARLDRRRALAATPVSLARSAPVGTAVAPAASPAAPSPIPPAVAATTIAAAAPPAVPSPVGPTVAAPSPVTPSTAS